MQLRSDATARALSLFAACALAIGTIVLPSWANQPSAAAQEIDCDDVANVDAPECIEQRGGTPPQPAAQEQPAPPAPEEPPPPPAQRANDPWAVVFGVDDAGKEVSHVLSEEGSDGCGRWARNRFERGRELGPSRLGPNVLDTKAWICSNPDQAKALFKTEAAKTNFPERKERVQGPNERFKKVYSSAEQTDSRSGYYEDNTVFQHYRIVLQKGPNVAVMYLFGREDLWMEKDRKTDNGLVQWFVLKLSDRL